MFFSKSRLKYFLILFALTTSLTLTSCDKGISPYFELNTGAFSGKVTFRGNWPAGIMQTYIIVFRSTLKSNSDFSPPNLSYVIGPIPYGTTEYSYNSIDNNAVSRFILSTGSYSYIVVAQSTKSDLSLDRKDWTVAGIYYSIGDTINPGVLNIEKDKITENINITCDFNNPPPQPPTIFNN